MIRILIYTILALLVKSSYAAVETDVTKTGATTPFTTKPTACTMVATPADADMPVVGSYCWRSGKFLRINTVIAWNGAGTAGALTLSIASITGAPVIDTSVLVNSGGNTNKTEIMLGTCKVHNVSTGAWFTYQAVYKSTTTLEVAGGSAHLQGNTFTDASVNCELMLPIVGW